MLKLSTGCRVQLLGPRALDDILRNGCIRIFSGEQPASADDPEQGQLLAVATANALPWTAGSATNGLLYQRDGLFVSKSRAKPWAFKALSTADAGWFRVVGNDPDSGGASFDAVRIDGAIGPVEDAPEMVWNTPSVTAGKQYPIDQFLFTLPPFPGT